METAKTISTLLIIMCLCNISKAEKNRFSPETSLEGEGPPASQHDAPVQGFSVTPSKSTPYTLSYGKLSLAWENYKLKYNKMYTSVTEEQMRFAIFRDKVKSIEQHNFDYHIGLTTYWKDINFFSDKLPKELHRRFKRPETSRLLGGTSSSGCSQHSAASDAKVPESVDWRAAGYDTDGKYQDECGSCWAFAMLPKELHRLFKRPETSCLLSDTSSSGCSQHSAASDAKVPESVDWRAAGYVTDVKYQDECGSCWAFATTGSLEGQWYKKTKRLISLSDQQLVDCDEKNDGCDGGLANDAFIWLRNNGGIMSEADYPYERQNGTCRFDKSKVKVTVAGCRYTKKEDEDELKRAVAEVGPIAVNVHVTGDFEDYGGEQVFSKTPPVSTPEKRSTMLFWLWDMVK